MFYQFAVFLAGLLGLSQGSHLYEAFVFFVQDTVKILILLLIMMSVMTFLRMQLPIEKVRDYLEKKFFVFSHFMAAIFGAITPFCSCSSLPLFFTLLNSGLSVGVAFSFLITSPLVNEVALIMLWGFFGFKFMLIWLLSAIFLGTFLGIIFEKIGVEKYLTPDFVENRKTADKKTKIQRTFTEKIKICFKKGAKLTKSVIWYVLIGIAVGAFIHGFLPEDYFKEKISADNLFAVPVAVILAVPLYANASGVIPIVQSLVAKGIPLGTALAFMMATVGLSFPEAMILKKAMKWQLMALFFGSVAFCIILIGYLVNWLF